MLQVSVVHSLIINKTNYFNITEAFNSGFEKGSFKFFGILLVYQRKQSEKHTMNRF